MNTIKVSKLSELLPNDTIVYNYNYRHNQGHWGSQEGTLRVLKVHQEEERVFAMESFPTAHPKAFMVDDIRSISNIVFRDTGWDA